MRQQLFPKFIEVLAAPRDTIYGILNSKLIFSKICIKLLFSLKNTFTSMCSYAQFCTQTCSNMIKKEYVFTLSG